MAPKAVKAQNKAKPAKAPKAAPKASKPAAKPAKAPAKSSAKKASMKVEDIIENIDVSKFNFKPAGSKCKGHKFEGLVLYDVKDKLGLIVAEEPITFHCDDERLLEMVGDFTDKKDVLCKGSPLEIGKVEEEGKPKAKKAAAKPAAAKKTVKAAAKPKAAKKAPVAKKSAKKVAKK